MGGTSVQRPTRYGSRRGYGFWLFAILVAVAVLTQACSDNTGPAGPHFQNGQTVPTVGTADTAAGLVTTVIPDSTVVPTGHETGITVLVTNLNGFPIPGRQVQLVADGGQFQGPAIGVTDARGRFVTIFLCRAADDGTTRTISVFVQGATGTAATQPITCGTPSGATGGGTTGGTTSGTTSGT